MNHINLHDDLAQVRYLVEAAYMAGAAIENRDHLNAIQHVCMVENCPVPPP